MIISASRRTDIPSYYGEWFINRLKEGVIYVVNPYNTKRYSKVNCTKECVDMIVFWSKNPKPFFKYLSELDEMGYNYYFQFTLTPYDKSVEKRLPNKKELIKTFIDLSKRIGKNKVIWRYDPIILNETLTLEYHAKMFEEFSRQLSQYTERCIISFVDSYKKEAAMSKTDMHLLGKLFSDIAKKTNLKLYTCSEQIDLSEYNINHGACIDKELIEKILGQEILVSNDKNQREACCCAESIEIGTYSSCANGCSYCYAMNSEKKVLLNMANHHPDSNVLIGALPSDAINTNRDTRSIINKQIQFVWNED